MTMTLIETKTLGTAAASIEFTSIPQTFTDLLIVSSLRSTRNAGIDTSIIRFNGITTGYSLRELGGDGAAAFTGSSSTAGAGLATDAANTANTFANNSCYIPNYAGSTNKSFSTDTVNETNATTAYQILLANLWSNTAAITSFILTPNVGPNWAAGSTVSLYGITKGSDGIVTTS
jgi:hypothetical protein